MKPCDITPGWSGVLGMLSTKPALKGDMTTAGTSGAWDEAVSGDKDLPGCQIDFK